MKKNQWSVLGIGLELLGIFFLSMASSCISVSGEMLVACYIRRYAFSIPGLIFVPVGILFMICGGLEKKK